MFYDAGKVRLNAELYRMESQVSVFGSEERKALRRAEKAEEAFRKSKGYPPQYVLGQGEAALRKVNRKVDAP